MDKVHDCHHQTEFELSEMKKNITLALSCFVALREQPRQSEMSEYVTLQKKKITKTKSVFLKCFSLLCSQWCFVVSLTSKSRQSG